MPGSFDYNVGRQIAATRPPFDALIFAAMEGADSANAARLALGFPELVAEWRRLRDLPPAPTAEPETHELYSWNERNRGWVAISQGTEDDLTEQEADRYASARKRAIPGCAFWVGEIADGAPQLPPADLGVEVTTA